MNQKSVILALFAAISVAAHAQYISDTKTFPPHGSSFLAGTQVVIGAGGFPNVKFDSMELTDFVNVASIPGNGFDGSLPTFQCALKTRTKSNNANERLTFSSTGFTPDQDNYLVSSELSATFDDGSAIRSRPGNPKTGHISINRRLIGGGSMGYEMTGDIAMDMDYSPDAGTTWYPFESTVSFVLQPGAVPEPSSALVIGIGVAAIALVRRRSTV